MEKIKKLFTEKKLHKKWWFWVAIVIFWGIGMVNMQESQEKAQVYKEQKEEQKKNKAEEKEKKDKEKAEQKKKEEEQKQKEEAIKEFTNVEVTEENVKIAIDGLIEKDIETVEVHQYNDQNIINITYLPGEVYNEKALVQENADNAVILMEKLFKNDKVDKVYLYSKVKMIDEKGNEGDKKVIKLGVTKEEAKNINWSNFKDMVKLDYTKLHNIADEVYIHPGIKKNIK